MVYDLKDVKQAAIGGFGTVLLFFAIRQGDPINIDPFIGLGLGVLWLFLLYKFNKADPKQAMIHFAGNLFVTAIITASLSLAFKMLPMTQLLSFGYFGSAAWISLWMAMPVAVLFDMHNITNVLDRYYARGADKGKKVKKKKSKRGKK